MADLPEAAAKRRASEPVLKADSLASPNKFKPERHVCF